MVFSVLLVDDEDGFRDLAKEYLVRDEEIRLTAARSAEEASELLRGSSFDVIVTDYQMPGMNGIEFLKARRSAGDETPFILFTGKGQENVVIDALNNGASYFLQKGLDAESQFVELANLIRRCAQRKNTERELRESEEQYRRLFDGSGNIVFTVDRSGVIKHINSVAAGMISATPCELAGRSLSSVFSRDESVRMLKEINLVLETNQSLLTEMPLTIGGREVWMETYLVPVNTSKGVADGVAGISRDISSRKKAEEALRESEERYHRLVAGMLDGVAYCQMLYDDGGRPVDWIYLNVNDNFGKLTGLQDMIGKRATEAIPGIDKSNPELFDTYGRVASNGQPEMFEIELKSLGLWLRISVFCPGKDHFVAVFENITKRKQLEDALKESEMKYRRLVELAQEGIWAIDADANTTYANPRMAEMLGYSPEEMLGRHLFSFMDERGKEIAQTYLDRRKQGIKELHDFEFLRKDGQRLYASLETSPMMDEAGNYTGALAVAADATERRRVEEALVRAKQNLENLIHSAPLPVVVLDLDANVTMWNKTAERVFGWTAEEVLGKLNPSVPLNDRQDSLARIKEAIRSGRTSIMDVSPVRKDGTRIDAIVSVAPMYDEKGRASGSVAMVHDITERKRAEEALRVSEARFQSFMSHIPAVAYMLDASDRYMYVNKAYEDAFDLKESDVVGKSVEEVWPAATAAAFRKTDQQVLASHKGIELIEVVPHTSGLREFLSFKFPVPDARGTSKVLGGVSIDITEQRRVEKALRQANKKLNLLGSVTRHDSINQLSVLFAWLEIAKEVAGNEPVLEHLVRVGEAAKAIQEQLEFTADYQELGVKQPEWIDLADAVNSGIEGLDKGKVSLNIDLVGIQVFADSMLEKVFHNLVDNTLRHGETVKSASISTRETEEGLTIICEDDGVGIPADDKERVFLRGFGKNTGFGLYLVREVLGITGMRIRETGVLGEGARFEIIVPSGNYKVSRQQD